MKEEIQTHSGNTVKIKVIMMMGQELLPEKKSGKFNQIRKEAGPETAQEMISWATFLAFFFLNEE